MSAPPPEPVLRAFGLHGEPTHLEGGQGSAFRLGEVVLKPGALEPEIAWLASSYPRIVQDGFRLAKPLRARDGGWTVDGWWAQSHLEGGHEVRAWTRVLAACRSFHGAVRHLPRPDFLDAKTDPWAVADRAAWGEVDLEPHERLAPAVGRLRTLLRPVDLPSQVIHGDFGGNVLFDGERAPAVIDMSPYWRPAPFALAVVVVDAIVWGGADGSLLAEMADEPQGRQMLVRGALRRILELDGHWRQRGVDHLGEVDAYGPVIGLIERACA